MAGAERSHRSLLLLSLLLTAAARLAATQPELDDEFCGNVTEGSSGQSGVWEWLPEVRNAAAASLLPPACPQPPVVTCCQPQPASWIFRDRSLPGLDGLLLAEFLPLVAGWPCMPPAFQPAIWPTRSIVQRAARLHATSRSLARPPTHATLPAHDPTLPASRWILASPISQWRS